MIEDRILEANVEAIRVVKEIQRNIEEDYDIQIPFEYLLEPSLRIVVDVLIFVTKSKK